MFPADSHWHRSVAALPTKASSAQLVATVGSTSALKADFGSGTWDGGPIGIPYVVVPAGQAKVRVTFDYDDESDPGPYPIPADPPVEGGPNADGDRHVLVVDAGSCTLYELYDAHPQAGGSWHAGSGAVWNLRSNALRPAGWTSADAAGLPILPGLVRYDEVAAGKVDHAIRMTVPVSRTAYTWPATHQAGSTSSSSAPAMGERFRLKATVDESTFPPSVRPIIRALKTYGGIVADNGSAWYLSGVPDPRWDNDDLQALRRIKGADFVAVDASSLKVSPTSGQAR
ncbi:hypothetical protein KSP35_20935 [Aquihabitans sp. G128]|uniref:hypothetical protein n=1 Tax=Aquihabitans sp. G128 TaxID=2849779 RepID=UPI001C22DFBB|nr:hypothetical protein [Aquihabitans sp. G128]QXC60758.1 hypothetical protein KSP35_20935 [Aquihabitans sp. G128]